MFCFQLMCIIVSEESDIAAFKDYQPSAEDSSVSAPATTAAPPAAPTPAVPTPAVVPTAAAPTPAPAAVSLPPPAPGSMIFASPFAKKIAIEKGVDLAVSNSL